MTMPFSSKLTQNVVVTFTPDSCSSSGNNPKTLDMSDIPLKLQIPFEQLELQGFLGQVSQFFTHVIKGAQSRTTHFEKTGKFFQVCLS